MWSEVNFIVNPTVRDEVYTEIEIPFTHAPNVPTLIEHTTYNSSAKQMEL